MSPLPESLLRFRTELEGAMRRELEAQASARSTGWGAGMLRAVKRRPGRMTLAFAAIAGAAAAALFVSSPWKTSPGFLEQVQAALTPTPGWILHVKYDLIQSSKHPACRTARRHEVWIDAAPPHRYRAIVPVETVPPDQRTDPREVACLRTTSAEVGGLSEKEPMLRFVPPNTLSFYPGRLGFPWDPRADVRAAISEGRAHRQGKTQLDGSTVERVRFDHTGACLAPPHCPREPDYGYFDPETADLVQFDYARDPVFPQIRNQERYLTFEYLPRTAANLALTDIRAQHPGATGP
jgi:hypothetical protein